LYTIKINQSGSLIYHNKKYIKTPCIIKTNNKKLIENQIRKLGIVNFSIKSDLNMIYEIITTKLKNPPSSFVLGCNKDIKDKRDFQIKNIIKSKKLNDINLNIPNVIDYSNEMTPVKNQKRLGSCVGFAITAMKEWQEQKEHNRELKEGKKYKRKEKYYNFSEMWAYYKSKEIDPWPNEEGTSIRCAMKQLSKHGIPPEKAWPYNDRIKGKPKSWSKMIAKWGLGGRYFRINNVNELINSLYKYGPIVIGILCFREIFNPKKGVVPYPKNPHEIFGGHAICITSYNKKQKLFKFKNSWGINWGNKGYGYLSYRYINDFMIDAWVMLDVNVSKNMLK